MLKQSEQKMLHLNAETTVGPFNTWSSATACMVKLNELTPAAWKTTGHWSTTCDRLSENLPFPRWVTMQNFITLDQMVWMNIQFSQNKPNVFPITLKFANEFPSNLSQCVSDKCLTMWHKTYQLHLIYVCTLPCKATRVKTVTTIV